MKEKSEESTPEESSNLHFAKAAKRFTFFFLERFLARQAGKGGREGSLGVLKWREKIIPYREVTHSYLLGCALTFASKAKFEIEAKISFRFEAKKKPDFT